MAFETQERRPGYCVEILPLIIGSIGGDGNKNMKIISKIFGNQLKRNCEVMAKMTKNVLWEGESLIRKILSEKFYQG